MGEDLLRRLVRAHGQLPEGCRSAPAREDEVRAFESRFGPIPPEYRWYLTVCGGGVVGCEWVKGIKELPGTHIKFISEPWTMKDVFVIGWDGGGNPFGIERGSGRLLVEDHNSGGVHMMASSFIDFLSAGLLRDDAHPS